MKRTINLTESELKGIIAEGVKDFIGNYFGKEGYLDDPEMKDRIENEIDWEAWNSPELITPEKAQDNYSWEQFDSRSGKPDEGETDWEMEQNYSDMYGDEKMRDEIGSRARKRWLDGASEEEMERMNDDMKYFFPGAMASREEMMLNRESVVRRVSDRVVNEVRSAKRVTESQLNAIVREAVEKEVCDDAKERLAEIDNGLGEYMSMFPNFRRSEDFLFELAKFADDNGLGVDDIVTFRNIVAYIGNVEDVDDLFRGYLEFKQDEEEDDRRREAQAWAEDQMAEMGLDDDSLA